MNSEHTCYLEALASRRAAVCQCAYYHTSIQTTVNISVLRLKVTRVHRDLFSVVFHPSLLCCRFLSFIINTKIIKSKCSLSHIDILCQFEISPLHKNHHPATWFRTAIIYNLISINYTVCLGKNEREQERIIAMFGTVRWKSKGQRNNKPTFDLKATLTVYPGEFLEENHNQNCFNR